MRGIIKSMRSLLTAKKQEQKQNRFVVLIIVLNIIVINLLTGMANAVSESKSVLNLAKHVSVKSWKN